MNGSLGLPAPSPCGRVTRFLLLGLILWCLIALRATAVELVGYLPEYRANRVATIPFGKLDRVVLFSADVDSDGSLRVPSRLLAMLKDVKGRVRDSRQLSLAIGGWGRSQGISVAAIHADKRARFIAELTTVCRNENLGGADIDWEFPKTAEEKHGFDLLLSELHAAFAPHGLRLSVAISASQVLSPEAVAAVDYIHLMSYDYGAPNHSPMAASQTSVERLLRAGVPAEKIYLGVPFYGRRLNNHNEEMPYDRILARFPAPALDMDEAGGYGFNSPVTLQRKLAYARERGLGGVMIWELGQDVTGDRSLLSALNDERAKHPRVRIQTDFGDIDVELDAQHAPNTASNFVRYVQAGLYTDGRFHRTVTLSNQPVSKVKIEVIQASANPTLTNQFFPPIKLERTRDTGLKHLDGTVSMARDGPDTAQDEFFICLGSQPELDFGGQRNSDGQGFAAFGKVIKGMDVVRKIQSVPTDGQTLTPPVKIQRILRVN